MSKEINDLDREKYYILGCSGGPDSMALFMMLIKEKFSFAIAFVNYHKRKESDEEEKMVKSFSDKYNIPFFALEVNPHDVKGNFQAWARDMRYEFFQKIYKENKADGLLIAHQKDDLLETYLLQKNRGGIYQYYGLKDDTYYLNMHVFRPLLNYRKEELKQYCILNNVPFSIDSSNLQDDYSRNKIRHQIIEKMSLNEIEKLEKEIELANMNNQKLFDEANMFIKQYNGAYPIDVFQKVNNEVQKRIIYSLLKEIDGINNLSKVFNVCQFLSNSNNKEMNLNEDLIVYKAYGIFSIIKREDCLYCLKVEEPKVIDEKYFYLDLTLNPKKIYIKEFSYPLIISNAYLESKVKIGNMEKKMNRLFVDEKIPNSLRKIWPVIKDCKGKILYVPRKKIIYDDNESKQIVFMIKG